MHKSLLEQKGKKIKSYMAWDLMHISYKLILFGFGFFDITVDI